jgi:hypothetical protein
MGEVFGIGRDDGQVRHGTQVVPGDGCFDGLLL